MDLSAMDLDDDLLLQDVYPRHIGDRHGKSCCIFASTLTIFNLILYGTVYILSDTMYDKGQRELTQFTEGTFLQNETSTKDFLNKLETAVNIICKEIDC
jgi:hypothetical protein